MGANVGQQDDLLFGKIALNKRYITRELLDRALQYQRTQAPQVPLGELLLQKGVLTRAQIDDVLEFQRRVKAKMTRPEGFTPDPNLMNQAAVSPYPPPQSGSWPATPGYPQQPQPSPYPPTANYPPLPQTATGSRSGSGSHRGYLPGAGDAATAAAMAPTADPDAPDPLIGQTIAGCVITHKLGAGGMGAVYHARKEALKKDFVVKILPPESAANHRTVERFKREAQAAAKLEHPNIVQVHDVGETETGLHYIVMQFVDGKNLEDVIQAKGRHTIAEATKLVSEIARGLEVAHRNGIIHRDIKADNILVTRSGVAKLADFGLAKDLNSDLKLTADGAMIGTPLYIAPEIGRVPQIDGRVDIYSLGVTYYYLLTGEQPFRPFPAVEILSAKAHEKLKPPEQIVPDLPTPVRNVLGKMLEKNRDLRYPDMSSVIRDLEAIERGQPVTAGPPSLWQPGAAVGPSPATSGKTGRRAAIARPQPVETATTILGLPPGLFIALVVVGVLVIGLAIALVFVLTR